MHCPSCGEEVSSGDEYCWHCGEEFPGGLPRGKAGRKTSDDERRGRDEPYHSEAGGISTSEETTVAALAHILGLFTWVLGPAVIFLITEDGFVKQNAANAVNWQVSLTIYFIVSLFLVFLLVGIPLLFILSIINLVFCIIATVNATDKETWEYPFAISFL